jgi:hypothetical protein
MPATPADAYASIAFSIDQGRVVIVCRQSLDKFDRGAGWGIPIKPQLFQGIEKRVIRFIASDALHEQRRFT